MRSGGGRHCSRALAGADENTSDAMGCFIINCDRLREEIGATVLGVHHTPSGGQKPRGSTVLEYGSEIRMAAQQGRERSVCAVDLCISRMPTSGEEMMFGLHRSWLVTMTMARMSRAPWSPRQRFRSRGARQTAKSNRSTAAHPARASERSCRHQTVGIHDRRVQRAVHQEWRRRCRQARKQSTCPVQRSPHSARQQGDDQHRRGHDPAGYARPMINRSGKVNPCAHPCS